MTATITTKLIWSVIYTNEDGESWASSFDLEEDAVAWLSAYPTNGRIERIERQLVDDTKLGIQAGSEWFATQEAWNYNDELFRQGDLWGRESERDARTGIKSAPKEAKGLFYGEELRDVRGATLADIERRDRLSAEATCNCSNPFCQV